MATTNALMLSIPNSCSENWNNMTPQEKGRFCDSCQKCVVDFTAMTDAAVLDYFNKYNGKICGRFDKRQLDRVLIINDKRFQKRFNIAASLLLLSSLGFGNTVKNEAVLPLKVQQFDVRNTVSEAQNKFLNDSISNDRITIGGKIFTAENPKEPLVGASILIKGTSIGRVTDIEGEFAFTIPIESLKDGILVVSFVGYETQELELSKLISTEHLVINLKESEGLSGEIIILDGNRYKPNLWKRFTNLFRRKKS
jgi:CarboxypepD_reg-like domain